MVEKISNGVDDINLTVMISKCNMAGNPKEWWIDTRATRHICANRSMFSSYTTVGVMKNFIWVIHQPLRLKVSERLL